MLVEHYPTDKRFEEVLRCVPALSPELKKIDVVELAEGDPVVVTLDAIPGVELSGTIESIGQTFSENQGDTVYKVTILLTDTDPAMRRGMTAEVKFEE